MASQSKSVRKEQLRFEDIGANYYAKDILREAMVIPSLFPDKFENRKLPQNSFLLYGPPGVGKTMMAKAVMNEIDAYTIWVNYSDLI